MKTPDVRKRDIEFKVRALNWQSDSTLKRFGMSIATQMSTVPARRLANPVLAGGRDMQGGSTFEPSSGKWDLRGYRLNSVSPLYYQSNYNSPQPWDVGVSLFLTINDGLHPRKVLCLVSFRQCVKPQMTMG